MAGKLKLTQVSRGEVGKVSHSLRQEEPKPAREPASKGGK